jgi:hypothetical protein
MSNPDMSPDAITRRLQRLNQLRELCIHLKQAGQKAGLHKSVVQNEPVAQIEMIKRSTQSNFSLF